MYATLCALSPHGFWTNFLLLTFVSESPRSTVACCMHHARHFPFQIKRAEFAILDQHTFVSVRVTVMYI